MKTIKYAMIALFSLLVCIACEKDGDKIYLSPLEEGELMATDTEVALTVETNSQVVLSLAWTKNTLKVSDASMSASNVQAVRMQVAVTEDFLGKVTETVETSLSKAYIGMELNSIAKNLGAQPDVPTTLYFRLKTSVADNMQPVYSNVVSVSVTSYRYVCGLCTGCR